MITKNTLKVAAALIAGFSALTTVNAADVNENVRLNFSAKVSAEYNDNIYLNTADKVDDVILHFIPATKLSLGSEVAESSFNVSLSEDFSYYLDHDQNNTQNTHLNAVYSYSGAKLKATASVGYDMMSQNSARDHFARAARRGNIIRYDTWYARADGDYQLTSKLSTTAGLGYTGKRYRNHRDSYADSQSYTVPVSLLHTLVTEKIRGGLSYQYTYTDLSRYNGNMPLGYTETHFVGFNVQGVVDEKLNLNVRVGSSTISYHRRYDNRSSSSTLSFLGTVNYKATEKTNASLTFNRDFEISGTAQSIKATGVTLRLTHNVDSKWSFNESVSWVNDDYVSADRKDNIYTLSAGASYRMNDYLTLGASYKFQWNDSDVSEMSYTNNVLTLSATANF
ncbi:MAG: outer membrane beta-barrel protein [Opitutales bacterium]|nr:outer membrane beta-barrel protein [Opitutales bacterium]